MKRPALAITTALIVTGCSYDSVYPTERAPTPPAAVDVVFCASAAPLWVGVQDGDGDFVRVTAQTSGAVATYHLVLHRDRAAIAVARAYSSGLTTLAVEYGVPAQLAAAGDGTAAGCAGSFDRTIVGNVAGLDTNEAATISADAHAFDFVSPIHGTDFRLENLDAGPQDILAARFSHVGNATKFTGLVLRHGVDPTGPDADIDFRSREAFLPVTEPMTVIGLEGSLSQVYGLRTARGGDRILSQTNVIGGSPRVLVAAPEAALAPSDLQFVVGSAPPIAGTNVVRAAKTYFRTPVGVSLGFGPIPLAPVLTIVATAPALRVSARFADQPEYDQAASINFQQGQSRVVSILMTTAYARRAGGYRIVVPDLSSVAGFDGRWALDATQPILWTSSRIGGTLGLGVNAVPSNGTVVRIATDAGNIAPP